MAAKWTTRSTVAPTRAATFPSRRRRRARRSATGASRSGRAERCDEGLSVRLSLRHDEQEDPAALQASTAGELHRDGRGRDLPTMPASRRRSTSSGIDPTNPNIVYVRVTIEDNGRRRDLQEHQRRPVLDAISASRARTVDSSCAQQRHRRRHENLGAFVSTTAARRGRRSRTRRTSTVSSRTARARSGRARRTSAR